MTFQEFLDKYLGKTTTFGEPYGCQCVSLSKQFTKDVLGQTPKSYGGSAWKGFLNGSGTFDTNLWKKGDLRAGDVAQEGDILFSPPTSGNPHGHVAVAHDDNEMIEQNGKTGNGSGVGGDAIRLIPFKRDICGYWRLKSYVPTSTKVPYTPIDPHATPNNSNTPVISGIEGVWLKMPEKNRMYKDYKDTKTMTGAETRMLIDLAFFNKKL